MRNLKSVLPKYYKEDALVEHIQVAAQHMEVDRSVIRNELRLETSEVTLNAEEKSIGSEPRSTSDKQERADAVRARYWLINKNLSLADLQSVIDQSVYKGTISRPVDAPFVNPVRLVLTFDEDGRPKGSDQLIDRILRSLPCNVILEAVYRYKTHGELKSCTHESLASYTHDEIYNGDF